jgi:membrane fusion protein, multidrug efflux system
VIHFPSARGNQVCRAEGTAPPHGRHRGPARRRPARTAAGGLVVAAILSFVWGCGRGAGAGAPGDGQQPTEIGPENIAIVTDGVLRTGPAISGTLAPVRDAQLRAQVGGSVLRTIADQGQHVVGGQELAEIDAAGLRDDELSARAAVISAQTAADYAVRQAQRYDTLFKAGAVSDRDRETVVEQDAQAQAALADARARLVTADKQLANTTVRAPFAGVVADRDVSVGDVVQVGTLLYTVVDPSQLQLQAAVPADQIAAVRVGQPVAFSLNGYGDRILRGSVLRISPIADPSTREIQVYAALPNPDNALIAGLYASGRIVTDSVRGLMVPIPAIDTRNLQPVVERIRHGRVERVGVQLGMRDAQANRVQIVAGVAAGDTLLRGAAQAIDPGTVVRVTAVTDTTTAER